MSIIPKEISRANENDVKIIWRDDHESLYAAHDLRLKCPCAGCVDEMTGVVRVVATNVPKDIRPLKIDLVGRYAMSIQWSDGHRTGIYSFDKLRKMCTCINCSTKQ